MTFAYPWLLLLLLAIPVLAWLHGKWGRSSAFVYSSVQLVKPIAGLARSNAGRFLLLLRWLTFVLLIIALAQPRFVKATSTSRTRGIDIVVALDLSGSMASEDFELNGTPVDRLTIAKNVLEKFIDNHPNDRIGLVAFAGRPYVASPLTLDHEFLKLNLRRLYLGMIEDRTAIGSGLTTALNRLRDVRAKSRIVILMTDGQNNAGNVPPLTAAEAAQVLGIKVYTIGVGTRGEAPTPYTDRFGRKIYQMTKVDIDEPTLQEISDKTGGKYFRADNTEALRKIYADIDRLEKTDVEVKKFMEYRELFYWFLLGGLFTLILELILSNTVWRKLP
jgi:Ca-activated chloride channel family protein